MVLCLCSRFFYSIIALVVLKNPSLRMNAIVFTSGNICLNYQKVYLVLWLSIELRYILNYNYSLTGTISQQHILRTVQSSPSSIKLK